MSATTQRKLVSIRLPMAEAVVENVPVPASPAASIPITAKPEDMFEPAFVQWRGMRIYPRMDNGIDD